MTAPVQYPSNAHVRVNTQIINPSSVAEFTTYNIFKIISSICNSCVCKIFEYLARPSIPNLTNACKCKSCDCDECPFDYFESNSIELRLLYENKSNNKLDPSKDNSILRSSLVRTNSNKQPRSIAYASWWQKLTGKNLAPLRDRQLRNRPSVPCSCGDCAQQCLSLPSSHANRIITDIRHVNNKYESNLDNTTDLSHLSRRKMFGKPIENYRQDFDCRNVSVRNYPLVIQGKKIVYDPIRDEVLYLCSRCQGRDRSQWERYLGDTMKPQILRCRDPSVCKCSMCECLSCPFQKEASFAESLESYKSSAMRKYVENEWKDRIRLEEPEIHECRTVGKGCRHLTGSSRNFIKVNNERKPEKGCRTRLSCQQNNRATKMPVEEMLDTVYGTGVGIDVNDKNVSTENPSTILTNQLLKNKYGVYTLVNHETNTEYSTADKCVGTDLSGMKKQYPDKVKNYEYTLKIEIITPKFDETAKSATKQKIKKVSKNKIKEQTHKIMKEVIKDISKSSLLQDIYVPEKPDELLVKDSKIPFKEESQEQKRRSILKQKITPVSSSTQLASVIQNAPSMVSAVVSPNRSKVSNKVEDFIVSCFTPLQNANHNTGKIKNESNPEIPSKDHSILSQNYWSMTPPAQPSLMAPVDVIEKLVSSLDAPTPPTTDVDETDENNAILEHRVDDLRVQEPYVRRVSYHTVSLRWKLPKAIEEIIGYEILVDGKTIEKILNPRRCLAVVSCLPPVRRLLITIRTITRHPGLRGLLPCTTIGYQPRANKFIRI